MLGVLTDHYMRCSSDAAFCTILARNVVRPWSEVLVRSFGNDWICSASFSLELIRTLGHRCRSVFRENLLF